MIKAEELRLGNLLQVESGNLNVVMEIKSKSTRCSYQRQDTGLLHISVIDNEHLFGITLTEEWLLRFGFSKMKGSHYIINNDNFIFGVGKLDKPCDEYGWCFIYYNTDQLSNFFHHVHQLQNLYLSITGQELKIK